MRAVAIFVFVASAAAGYATASAVPSPMVESTTPTQISPMPPASVHVPMQLCAGISPLFALKLIPTQSCNVGGSDRLSIDIEAKNHADGDLSTAIAYEVIDDRGNVVVSENIVAGEKFAPADVKSLPTIGTPGGLNDGYYFARATGAWHGERTGGTTSTHLYFSVTSGQVNIIEASDWYVLSHAKEGFAL